MKLDEALEHPWLANWIKIHELRHSQSNILSQSQNGKQVSKRISMKNIQHLICKELETGEFLIFLFE